MSISSKSRKESTESYAAQRMRNTMGVPPALGQLRGTTLDNDLPSRTADSNDTDVPGDYEKAKAEVAINEDEESAPVNPEATAEIRNTQEPLPLSAEDASTDEDDPRAAYQPPTNEQTGKVADADWNRSTEEGALPATRANEPDRTLGNS